MKNMGSEQFNYESFKLAYDSDPRIKPLIKNFDQEGITLATDVEAEAEPTAQQQGATSSNSVSQMAKRATSARR
jgi:hypothetical protein